MSVVGQVYDQLADGYDSQFVRGVDIAENQFIFSRLRATNGADVLDLGCGTGLYLEYCNPRNYLGLDVSRRMIELARAKFPGREFAVGDMAALPLHIPRADWVISTFGSFSYCLDPHRVVRAMADALGPDGRFFLMAYGKRYSKRVHYIARDYDVPQIQYTAQELKGVLGFDNVRVYGMTGPWLDSLSNKLPQRMLTWLLALETRTLGRLFPDLCYWMIAEGRVNG